MMVKLVLYKSKRKMFLIISFIESGIHKKHNYNNNRIFLNNQATRVNWVVRSSVYLVGCVYMIVSFEYRLHI